MKIQVLSVLGVILFAGMMTYLGRKNKAQYKDLKVKERKGELTRGDRFVLGLMTAIFFIKNVVSIGLLLLIVYLLYQVWQG